ncbi:response regulator [Desulfovibrio sp. Fe33]|uniref:response regulator n=1 Tax=Desulfovibrio sp. Fe33 TaxID=3020842 RepID=UPI00234CED91|nr:response regulator [Desulfovibrio sp. Fe33]
MVDTPIRVLLVDDELGFLDVLAKRMGKRGYAVTTAGSGAESIRVLRDHDFDVAVLDLKLEDMDGIEVLQIMKKMVPELPVIMLTGHGSEQAAREGVESGAFDYLLKPCDLDDLLEKVGEAVAG